MAQMVRSPAAELHFLPGWEWRAVEGSPDVLPSRCSKIWVSPVRDLRVTRQSSRLPIW